MVAAVAIASYIRYNEEVATLDIKMGGGEIMCYEITCAFIK